MPERIKRVKYARTKRIIRIRNVGFKKLQRSFGLSIRKATFNIKDIESTSSIMFNQAKKGVPILPVAPLSFFAGLESRANTLIVELGSKYQKAFKMGADKIMDSKGNKLSISKPDFKEVIKKLNKENLKYVKNITDSQRKKMLELIRQGIKEGKGYKQIAGNINTALKEISVSRADMIASTEINKAISRSMKDTMELNGFKTYMWITAGDNRVAPLDEALHRRIFKFGLEGKMSVRGTDGKIYTISKSPMPVTDSHPRCRCVIVKPPTKKS